MNSLFSGMTIQTKITPAEEKQMVEELKKLLKDELPPEVADDDNMFIRFLRAREHNTKQAEEMIRNHIQWRKKYDIDNIEKYKPPEISQHFPLNFIGYDKSGIPVRYVPFGNLDVQGVAKSIKYEDCIKYLAKNFREDELLAKKQSEKLGRKIDQWMYIIDCENFTLSKATNKEYAKLSAQVAIDYENNYPERLKEAMFINTSTYFSILFNIVKPFISARTLSKLQMYGKDGWKDELMKIMHPDDLPAFLGGNKKDPDGNPKCLSFINHGGFMVPECYYFRSVDRRLCNQPNVQRADIANRSKFRWTLNVDEPGSLLEWEFESEDRDIGFGLYFQEFNSKEKKPKPLVPKERVDAHLASETGVYQCEKPGRYTVMFDNSYSILRHKEIYYRILVRKPDGKHSAIFE